MSSMLNKVKISSHAGGRPGAAVELAPEGVLAAVLRGGPKPGHSPEYAFVPLPPGALIAGIGEPNLRTPEVVAIAIRKALGDVSPRTRAVTVVLPDMAVRVFVLDFDSLPARSAEVLPVLRFRLRKMVPFDVERAGISYQMLAQNKTERKVLVAVLPGPILAEYEGAVRAAGYEPGAVLPSSLAALETIDSLEAVLAANLSGAALTTSITSGQDLLLHRVLDLPEDPGLRISEIQRSIAVAAAYFEDKLQARPRELRFAGAYEAQEFARWIDDPELEVVDFVPRPPAEQPGGAAWPTSVAGVTGALAGSR